jgi:hypothetical protein
MGYVLPLFRDLRLCGLRGGLVCVATFRACESRDDFRCLGTEAPARRACDSPIAIACALDLTRGPLALPLWSFPRLNSCIAVRTAWADFFSPFFRLSIGTGNDPPFLAGYPSAFHLSMELGVREHLRPRSH